MIETRTPADVRAADLTRALRSAHGTRFAPLLIQTWDVIGDDFAEDLRYICAAPTVDGERRDMFGPAEGLALALRYDLRYRTCFRMIEHTGQVPDALTWYDLFLSRGLKRSTTAEAARSWYPTFSQCRYDNDTANT